MTTLFSVALPQLLSNGSWTFGTPIANWPQPNHVEWRLPALNAMDNIGVPQLSGYGAIVLTYKLLDMSRLAVLTATYRATRIAGPLLGVVQLTWPDPAQNNALTSASARFDPILNGRRELNWMRDIVATFSMVGFDDRTITGFVLPPAGR